MKAAVVSGAGQVPAYLDFPEPVAGEDEDLVTVTAAAINPVTRSRASGTHYSSTGVFPMIPGVEGVGRRADGQRIFFFMPRPPYGALSERTVVGKGAGIALPDDLDDVTAAAIGNPGASSWAALTERAHFRPGQTVLVNGATGTAGRLAVQIARHLGAGRVIGAGRNPDVLERLKALGADAVIALNAGEDALEESFRAEFSRGVDVVLDYLWGNPARVALTAAAKAGRDDRPMRFVSIGSVAGAEIALPSAVLRSSSIELVGSGLGSIPRERLVPTLSALLSAAGSGRLTVDAMAVPLVDIAKVWTTASEGRRIVVTPGGAGA